jgi:hypothetical protein
MYLSMLRVAKSRRLLRVRPDVEGCAVLLFSEDSAMQHRQALTISNVCNGLSRDYRLRLFASFSSRSFASQTNGTSGKPDAKEQEPSPPPGAGGGGWFPWLSDIDDETKVNRMSKTIQANTTPRQEKNKEMNNQDKTAPRRHRRQITPSSWSFL